MTDYRTQGLNCESVCGKRISSERRIGRRNGATHRSSSHQIINSLLKFPYKEETPVIPPRRRGESRTPDIGASKMSAFSTGLHLEVRWLLETTVWRAKKRTGLGPHPVRTKTRRNAHEHRGVIMLCQEFWNQTEAGTPRQAALPLSFSPAPLARLMRGGAGEKEGRLAHLPQSDSPTRQARGGLRALYRNFSKFPPFVWTFPTKDDIIGFYEC